MYSILGEGYDGVEQPLEVWLSRQDGDLVHHETVAVALHKLAFIHSHCCPPSLVKGVEISVALPCRLAP